jgi:hypothetical protein
VAVSLAEAVMCVHAQRHAVAEATRTWMCARVSDDGSGRGAPARSAVPPANMNVCYAKRRAGAALAGIGS